MKQITIVLSRVLAYVETVDLNPGGRVFFPHLIHALVDKMEFQKYPTSFEDTDEEKGVTFLEGRWGSVTIDKLTIFRGALIVDTRVPTSETQQIIHECLSWATELGINYTPEMISRWQYISDLTFYSDVDLLSAHRAFLNLQKGISDNASKLFGQPLDYQFTRFDIDFDKNRIPLVSASFSIQRRGQVPFSENKYFSESALPTDIHIELLEKFEAELQG